MRRTTISLPDDLATALEREAHRRRTSVSSVVREALTAQFAPKQPRRLTFAAVGRSSMRSTAADSEHILAHEWANAIDRDR
jgi:Arc/MetJ-type ribon-helix-helix transcriptional regulator